jgi:hypothetical protein
MELSCSGYDIPNADDEDLPSSFVGSMLANISPCPTMDD